MDADKTTEFIANVQTMPVLWKKDDKDFFNRDKKSEAFDHLAVISGISADECKKKLKNLKDRMREVCSKLPKTRSGQPAFENGEATVCWTYYKPMLFMKDRFVGRPMIGNAEGDFESSQSIASDESVDGAEANSTSTPISAQSTLLMSTSSTLPISTSSRRNERKKPLSKPNRQRLEEEFLAIEREKIDSIRTTLQKKPEDDEWDTFFSSICSDLRKLKDPFIILRVKANIYKQVNEAVLEQLSLDRQNSATMEYHQFNSAQTSMGCAASMDYQRCRMNSGIQQSQTSDHYESQYYQK